MAKITLKDDWEDWAKALESGKYKQGKLQLGDESGYCCLGVRCLIHGIEFDSEDTHLPSDFDEMDVLLPFGDEGYGQKASILNDVASLSFSEIAAAIRRRAKKKGWTT